MALNENGTQTSSHADKIKQEGAENSVHFELSSSKLAEVLKEGIGARENGSPKADDADKNIYLDALLLNIAHTATTVMEHEARLNGDGLAARMQYPAHGILRVGKFEASVYDLIDKGDADAVKSIVKPQIMTFTAHPNFSRSAELVEWSKELATELGKLSRKDQQTIMEGKLPDNERIQELLGDIKDKIKLRSKRTREQELKETTLDMIPTALDAASEQLRIFKKRRQDVKHEQDYAFSNTEQLKAFARLLPEYNSWFLDGDGKRTVHAYDAEVAVPAMKRATYEEYAKSLEKLGDLAGIREEYNQLKQVIEVLKQVESAATTRMNAYNEMHEAYEADQQNGTEDTEQRYDKAKTQAAALSLAYDQLIRSTPEGMDIPVMKLMQRDDAGALKQKIGDLLNKDYQNHFLADNTREVAEDLYIKLERYGNYAVRNQRRENADKYKEVFTYLVQRQDAIMTRLAETISKNLGKEITGQDLLDRLKLDDTKFYTKAIESFAELMKSNYPELIDPKRKVLKTYVTISQKLGKTPDSGSMDNSGQSEQGSLVSPLQERELLTLDDLGMFRMASLYPEAFKGGFVIAEFAQPARKILQQEQDNPDAIKAEVARVAHDDTTLQMAFADAMGAKDIEIIPLHEDPATMEFAADAQEKIRSKGFIERMLNWMGVNHDPLIAETKALKHIDDNGEVQKLTAYQYMQQFGYGDEELAKRGLDKERLEHMLVLEGPHDMEACSDNNKRAGVMGSVLADQSVRSKVAAAAALPETIGDQEYMIVKPKYLGQGGAIARAVQVPLDTVQATWQGEHTQSFTPASLAHRSYNSMLGRLLMREEAARYVPSQPTNELADSALGLDSIAAKYPHVGNVLGLPGTALLDKEKGALMQTINMRLDTTRDDPRYDAFLTKYGEPVTNYSSRPDAKGKGKSGKSFNEGRAIGIAGLESGIFSNVVALAEVFAPLAGDEDSKAAVLRFKEWRKKDPMIQQITAAAALTANFVNLEEKWQRGGIKYREVKGVPILHKYKDGGRLEGHAADIRLQTLVDAYENKETKEYTDAVSGVKFDEADLVMAHLTDQYNRMVKGLEEIFHTKNKLEFVPEGHRADVEHAAELNTKILERWHETKGARATGADPEKDSPHLEKLGQLALDAYYLLHESGSIYPIPALLEKQIYEDARQRGEQAIAA